nr:immunoglobulin light chain junction region [Macaca mulatta]
WSAWDSSLSTLF